MSEKKSASKSGVSAEQMRQIQTLAETLQYGTITLAFQDGILIQIEKNEKFQLNSKRNHASK